MQTFNLRPKKGDLSATWTWKDTSFPKGIVANKVGSGVWQDVGGMAAGLRGRSGQGSFSLHLQSQKLWGGPALSPVAHPQVK